MNNLSDQYLYLDDDRSVSESQDYYLKKVCEDNGWSFVEAKMAINKSNDKLTKLSQALEKIKNLF